uniref:SNARE associated Golgi protein n=1 Tax=Lotus japonicus TaxID=34305 RepID=I3S5L7_LOTJA|nr:unknown [Lotus japonicus]
MTYLEGNDGGRSREGDGDYVKLRWGTQDSQSEVALPSPPPRGAAKLWFWVKLVASFLCLGLLAFIVFQWVGPFFIEKVIIPITNWERNRFSPSELAVMLFGSIALFPTLLLPSSPSMWMAGMLFGYVLGFMLIISAAAVGVSLPFFIGSIFHRKIERVVRKVSKESFCFKICR